MKATSQHVAVGSVCKKAQGAGISAINTLIMRCAVATPLLTPQWPLRRRLTGVYPRSVTPLRAESVEGAEKRVISGRDVAVGYVSEEEGFSLSQVSFGTILSPLGVGLMVFGFCAYFDFIPGIPTPTDQLLRSSAAGGDVSSLLLVYGFPLSLLGFALKYAELKPVPCRATQAALNVRDAQRTDIQKQVKDDSTRFRYGDEQHLEEALERIFRIGRAGEIPRNLCPVLTGLREETRTVTSIDGPLYTLVLEFEAELTEEQWTSKLSKFQSFFGPGILAELVMTDTGAEIELICDGSGAGKTGAERKDVLPPLLPGLAPRKQD